MKKTLEQFFESHASTRTLVLNLQDNIEAMGDEMSREEQDTLMGMNLIFIRQCLEDFGAE